MENLRFECTLLSSVRVSLSREERLSVTRNNRLPISFALSFTKRIRRIPYLSIFELFLRGNPFESRPFLSEKKKRKRNKAVIIDIERDGTRLVLKKNERVRFAVFSIQVALHQENRSIPLRCSSIGAKYFFFLFFYLVHGKLTSYNVVPRQTY